MAVVSMVNGGVTDSRGRVVTEVDGVGDVRLLVADNPRLTGGTYFGPVTPDAQHIAVVEATGLDTDARYYAQVEHGGILDTGFSPAQMWTDPVPGEPADLLIACAGDAGLTPEYPGVGAVLASDRLSNHPVFDDIRTLGARRFIHPGDTTYYNMGTDQVGGATLANFRRMWSDLYLQPRQHELYRVVRSILGLDDHDGVGNNSRGADDPAGFANCLQAIVERSPTGSLLPHPGDGHYYSELIGRVLIVMLDVRTQASSNGDPDGPGKTMLGSVQKQWLERTLITGRAAGAEYLVVVSGSQWTLTNHIDSWASFATARSELVQMFGDTGWLRTMTMLYADRHAFGLDTGSHNLHGGFPLMMAASLDATPSQPASDRWDTGFDSPERGQYGTIGVQDGGHQIVVTLSGYRRDQLIRRMATAITVSHPITSVPLRRAVAGSHKAVFEARVVTDYQTGSEPSGTVIPILGGDVTLDATAEVRGTLNLDTTGAWPRGGDDLLAPWGNEVFVRRGVDLGGDGIAWVPLGYYRIEEPEQDDSPGGPITLTGRDRMAGIVDARFVEPRLFTSSRTVGSVVRELVGEIYPEAAIVWDDDTAQTTLGRDALFEEDRHGALMNIVTSRGKVTYWDGAGALQIRDAPDPTEVVWEVKQGRRGVLVQASRRLSREGTYNGVVATGEGTDEQDPVRAVVVDRNPRSGTAWGGRFGRKPRFYASPLITTEAQALSAARSILRRSIGFPYNVDFAALPHPALEPDMAVRITQRDGREVHILQTVTIPLTANEPVTATTKEQTLVVLGEV